MPAAKRAVHHLTAPHHVKPVRRLLTAASRLPAEARRPADCDPTTPVAAVPLVTYAAPIPSEPGGSTGSVNGVGGGTAGPAIGALAAGAPVAAVALPAPGADPGPVPEPATWLLLIIGAGVVGATMRRRHVTRPGTAAAGLSLWGTSAAVEAGDVATTVVAKSAVASAAGKALLCVCPAAVVAGSVMTVPPLRQAVHAATANPAAPTPAASLGTAGLPPCEGATIPVSATAVNGFPDQVSTVAATPPAGTAGAAPVPVARVAAPSAAAR